MTGEQVKLLNDVALAALQNGLIKDFQTAQDVFSALKALEIQNQNKDETRN